MGALLWGALGFLREVKRLSKPQQYVDLHTQERCREIRPFSDVVKHVTIFLYLRPLLRDGWLFQRLLAHVNSSVLTWDLTFEERGQHPRTVASSP